MVRGRRELDTSGGRQNNFSGSNRYFDRADNVDGRNRSAGNYRGRGGTGSRGSRGGNRGGRGGFRGGYNRHQDQNHENGNFERNRFSRDGKSQDNESNGFKKFSDPNATPSRRNSISQHKNFGSQNYNNYSEPWYRDSHGDYKNRDEAKSTPNKLQTTEQEPPPMVANVQEPSVKLHENTEPKEPKLLRKIKTEKVQQDESTPKSKNKKPKCPPSSDSSSSADSSSEEEESVPVKNKSKDKTKPVANVKIKKEISEKKKAIKEAPAAVPPPPPETPPAESSSESSSATSSSGEDEIPQMPKPIKSVEATKPKKERSSEQEVVCLGKMNNIENLVDDEESTQSQACIVCNKSGHSATECQMKCKKCTHSSYECHVVCKNCGEAYGQNNKSTPKQPPNPFVMFMQFMQFCMSQYYDSGSEIKYPFPQFESASAPVLGPTPTVEVTRNDIANLKRARKRTKSDSKQSRKKHHASMNSDMNSESDSESSSKATTSTKKRKKHGKSSAREAQASQNTKQQQQQQHQQPSFGGQLPASMPFPGAFGTPGYNPMLAFSHMMGYNPATMNFPR